MSEPGRIIETRADCHAMIDAIFDAEPGEMPLMVRETLRALGLAATVDGWVFWLHSSLLVICGRVPITREQALESVRAAERIGSMPDEEPPPPPGRLA